METQTPAAQDGSPFLLLLKSSFGFLKKNILKYLKMTFILALPLIIIFAALFFYFKSALAAPRIQSAADAAPPPAVTTQATITDTVAPAPDPAPAPNTETSQLGEIRQAAEAADAFQKKMDQLNAAAQEAAQPADSVPAAPATDPKINANNEVKTPPEFRNADLGGALGMGLIGLALGSIGLFLLIGLIFGLYVMFAGLAMTRLTVMLDTNPTAPMGDHFKWAFGKMGSYIMLCLRIFFYTWIWLPFVAGFILGIAGPRLGLPSGVFMVISVVIGVSIVVMALIRVIRASFGKWALVEKDCGSKDALNQSIEITKGHWWQIVLYLIGMAIITGFVQAALTTVFTKINDWLGLAVQIILSLAIAYFMIIFQYAFYRFLQSKMTLVSAPVAAAPQMVSTVPVVPGMPTLPPMVTTPAPTTTAPADPMTSHIPQI